MAILRMLNGMLKVEITVRAVLGEVEHLGV